MSPDDSKEIQPALTVEQWARFAWLFTGNRQDRLSEEREVALSHMTWQGVAALALYGQPWGFRREDVDDLRSATSLLRGILSIPGKIDPAFERGLADLSNIADRIAALLPPRTEG